MSIHASTHESIHSSRYPFSTQQNAALSESFYASRNSEAPHVEVLQCVRVLTSADVAGVLRSLKLNRYLAAISAYFGNRFA